MSEAGFRTLRYDVYGRGWSDRPRGPYDLDFYVSQLERLLNELDIRTPVDIVALSMGAPIAATYTNRFPERVRRVCLLAPQGARFAAKKVFPLNVPVVGEILMAAYVAPVVIPRAQMEDFAHPERFPEWEARFREPMDVPGFSRAMLSLTRSLPKIDPVPAYEKLASSPHQAILIWGREDQAIRREEIDAVLEAMPQIGFHIIEDAGHLAHFERSDMVNPILLEFLGRD